MLTEVLHSARSASAVRTLKEPSIRLVGYLRRRPPRAARRAEGRTPGERARAWQRMLDVGLYESRAALARGEGVSRAAMTQGLLRIRS